MTVENETSDPSEPEGTDVTIHNLMFCLGNVKATCEYSDRTSYKFCYSKTSQKYLYESSKVWTD